MGKNIFLKFLKGLKEQNLSTNIVENGSIYHCEDTGNTYLGKVEEDSDGTVLSKKLLRYSSSVGKTIITPNDTSDNDKIGEIFNDYTRNDATGHYSHAEGSYTFASGDYSHAEGNYTIASGLSAHVEGYGSAKTYNQAIGTGSHAEGSQTKASGNYSHAEGNYTIASGLSSHSEGYYTQATGSYSHAEGYYSEASGYYSHAEGGYKSSTFRTIASGPSSHAEGVQTKAGGSASHAEGTNTEANSTGSHSEGYYTIASGIGAHAEGYGVSGSFVTASGAGSHAEGYQTIAGSNYQHVQGKYNIEDSNNVYAHIVGNGNPTGDNPTRSNAHTLDWEGNAWFAGDVYVKGSGQDDTENVHKLSYDSIEQQNTNSPHKNIKFWVGSQEELNAIEDRDDSCLYFTTGEGGEEGSGGPSIQTISLLSSNWDINSLSQNINITGIIADPLKQIITVSPSSSSREEYLDCGIQCVSQGTDSLTFKAESIPNSNLSVYVAIQKANS